VRRLAARGAERRKMEVRQWRESIGVILGLSLLTFLSGRLWCGLCQYSWIGSCVCEHLPGLWFSVSIRSFYSWVSCHIVKQLRTTVNYLRRQVGMTWPGHPVINYPCCPCQLRKELKLPYLSGSLSSLISSSITLVRD
jgi:hypothetical protein